MLKSKRRVWIRTCWIEKWRRSMELSEILILTNWLEISTITFLPTSKSTTFKNWWNRSRSFNWKNSNHDKILNHSMSVSHSTSKTFRRKQRPRRTSVISWKVSWMEQKNGRIVTRFNRCAIWSVIVSSGRKSKRVDHSPTNLYRLINRIQYLTDKTNMKLKEHHIRTKFWRGNNRKTRNFKGTKE